MNTANKSLLVRADFVLGNRRGGDRVMCKRWRRALAEALPRLLGCADRRPAVRVRLHEGEGEACFSGWLRIPIERRPNRRRLRKFKAKLRARLEDGLRLVDGEVLKLGVRRCRPRQTSERPVDAQLLLPFADGHPLTDKPSAKDGVDHQVREPEAVATVGPCASLTLPALVDIVSP